jgi:hypothetical protein
MQKEKEDETYLKLAKNLVYSYNDICNKEITAIHKVDETKKEQFMKQVLFFSSIYFSYDFEQIHDQRMDIKKFLETVYSVLDQEKQRPTATNRTDNHEINIKRLNELQSIIQKNENIFYATPDMTMQDDNKKNLFIFLSIYAIVMTIAFLFCLYKLFYST